MSLNTFTQTVRPLVGWINFLRITKFVSVGVFCTGFQYWFFFLALRLLNLEAWWQTATVNAAAFTLSTQLNFVLSSQITWSDRLVAGGPLVDLSKMARFNLMSVTSLVTNTLVFAAASVWFEHLPSLMAGTLSGLTLSYLVSHRFVFAQSIKGPSVVVVQTASEG